MSAKIPKEISEEALLIATRGAHLFSGCLRSRRGVVLWHPEGNFRVYGTNKPATGTCDGSDACKKVCGRICIHAEQDALLKYPDPVGAELLHVKVDASGQMVVSGPPSCDQCSKLILRAGIAGVWLLHEEGWKRYTAQEFHEATLQTCGLNFVRATEQG